MAASWSRERRSPTPPRSPDYLAARASATRSLLVLIQADRDVSYQDLARVLAACRASGVAEIALAAELRAGS